MDKNYKFLLVFFFLSFYSLTTLAQNATVVGTVIETTTNSFLTGTTVMVVGSSNLGAVAGDNGEFTILSVPSGSVTLRASFIGYQTKEIRLDLKPGETKRIEIEMEEVSIEGKELVVTAQARGQRAAINRQVNATGIVNIVSGEKLNELPDINAADAIGRLPGIMVQREGGEGQKIIIRGLEPKYNSVSINGMSTPATNLDDRSTDLNMVSPEIIGGVEVIKAITADKDADGIGGSVNFTLREAPSGFRLTAGGQTGYHSQINNIGHYKGNITLSDRVFDRKLGYIIAVNIDRTDRSNDRFRVDYTVQGNPTPEQDFIRPWSSDARIQSNLETRDRQNANINLDYSIGANKFKLINLLSRMSRDRLIREKRYDLEGSSLRLEQNDIQSKEWIISNTLHGEHSVFNTFIEWGAGRSSTNQHSPYDHELSFRTRTPYLVPSNHLYYIRPDSIPAPGNIDETQIGKYYLHQGTFNTTEAKETEYNVWLDWKIPYKFTDALKGYIKIGGKYRNKNREKITGRNYVRYDLSQGYDGVLSRMPDITLSEQNNLIGVTDFLNNNYTQEPFLYNRYEFLNFNYVIDRNYMRDFYSMNSDLYRKILTTTVQNDYSGAESLSAAYIMTEFNIGKYISFIPGIRYDHTYMKYHAYKGDNIPDSETEEQNFSFEETTGIGSFGYWLPQIHLQIKPAKWVNLRLAYTNTLSRPDYNLLAPRVLFRPSSLSVIYSKTDLQPSLSKNYDAILTFYDNEFGLFSIGGFYKEIENFIFTRRAIMHPNTSTQPEDFGLNEGMAGWTINYPLNSPNKAYIKGLELDLQTQLSFLPGILSGIVLSGNFTIMDSKTNYNETLIMRAVNPNYGVDGDMRRFINVNVDTTYTDRLLKQPRILANLSLGYDYKGFSGRISYNYQDNILIKEQHRTDGADKESTLPFSKWDLQLKQRITPRLDVLFSMSNMSNSPDVSIRDVTGFISSMEYYGITAYIGFKYKIFD